MNYSEIVLVDSSKVIVIAYTKDINEKTLDVINNNNIQALTYDPTIIYTKQINSFIRNSKVIIHT